MEGRSAIPTLEDLVEPSAFVQAYKDLEVSEYIGQLAPSLGLVITRSLYNPAVRISREFIDPETFLGMTHFSPAVLTALSLINRNLRAGQGAITLPLTQEMGLGKTHFLTLLWHLYTEVPLVWNEIRRKVELEDAIEKLTAKAYYRRDVAAKSLVLALDLKRLPPEFRDPYAAIFETCGRIIEEYGKLKEEINKRELVNFIRSLAEKEPKSAASEFASFLRRLGISIPVLILMDELYASVFEAAEGGDEETIARLGDLFIFITSFIDEIKEFCPVALIYASAQQDINRWNGLVRMKDHLIRTRPPVGSLLLAAEHFQDRTSRVESISMEQTTSEDAVEVILKRLFRFKMPKRDAAREAAESCVPIVRQFLGDEAVPTYYNELLNTYPLTPTYMFLAEKLLAPTIGGDLPRTQHVRDLLKVTAALVARVHEGGEWDRATLVTPAYLVHGDVNHLLQERYAMEWGRLYDACLKSIKEIRDNTVRSLAEKMLSVVYAKSLTTNISKLLDMIRAAETISRQEVFTRGSSSEDLLFSLVGAVPQDNLEKFHEAREYIASSTPYVVEAEHAGIKYVVVSFVPNPLELIESFTREETSKYMTTEGRTDPEEMKGYLRRHLEVEYRITKRFTEISQREGRPKLSLVDLEAFIAEGGEKPKFLNYLDRNNFTVLVVSPWSVVGQGLKESPIEEIRSGIQQYRNDISYLNMFAVVAPEITNENLENLCLRVAEVHASTRVLDFFRVREVSEARARRLELARRAPTYQTLREFLEQEERRYEDMIIEIMGSLQKKIEEYAKNYTNTAVQNYVGGFVGSYRHLIYYDPQTETFKKEPLDVRYERRELFENVYAEFPVWVSDAVISRCGVDRRNAIMSKIIEYIVQPEVARRKDELLSGEKVTLDTEPYVEAMMRGWKELPIRPLSRIHAETAFRLIGPSVYLVSVEDIPQVRVSPQVIREDEREIVRVVIETLEFVCSICGETFKSKEELNQHTIKAHPRIPTLRGILIGGVNDVIIGMELLKKDRLGRNVKSIDLRVKTSGECWFKVENAQVSDLSRFFGSDALNVLVNRLSSISPELDHAELQIRLEEPMKNEDAERLLDVIGVSRRSVTLRAAEF